MSRKGLALAGAATLALLSGAAVPAGASGASGASGAAGGAVPASVAAADRRGERLFLQCRACHALGAAQEGKIGPPLGGVMGRRAAAVPGFAYSKALAESDVTWDDATLDRWLARPSDVVPGTSMVYAGLPKSEDRARLIEYLRRATALP